MQRPRIEHLLKSAATNSGCSMADLKGRCREANICDGRILFTALAKHYGYRQYEIGWALKKWHTSASYYAKRADVKSVDPYFTKKLKEIINAYASKCL